MITRSGKFFEREALPPQPVKIQTEKRNKPVFETCFQDIRFSGPGSERTGNSEQGDL
jgi:hypothetical protein